MKKAVLFDLGKVLLDFDKDVILDGFRRKTDMSEEEIRRGLKLYHELGFETGSFSPQEFYDRLNKELELNMTFGEFREVWCGIFREISPMLELFHKIRTKYKTYVLSNTDPLHFAYVLEKFPWLEKFDGRALSYELGLSKPEKKFFLKAMEKFDLDPSECIYIDDLEENVIAARQVGIAGIHHTSLEGTIAALKDVGINIGV